MNEPLVLLPGMMCDARLFGPQIAAISMERAVQIAPINLGETIEEIAASVLENAPPRFALAGLSMGANVAMEVLRRAPERVTRIALMDSNVQSETPSLAAAREPQIVRARTGNLAEVLRDEIKPTYLAPGPNRNDVLNLFMDMAMGLGPDVFVRQSRALQRRPDQQKTLRQIRVPSLVLCGEYDALCPVRRHEFMAELIPYARLQIIEDAGHFPTLEQPDATTHALNVWLDAPLILR